MKIAVMGAGSVGCYYGAMLALAGHQVILLGMLMMVTRRNAVSQVVGFMSLENGLILEKNGQRLVAQVEASCDPAVVAEAEMVMVCVKSGDTQLAGQQIAPYLSPGCLVLSLQNGVSNAETLGKLCARTVLPVVVYVASCMAGPGIVRHEGRGDLEMSGQGAGEIAAILNAAGIETRVSDDVMSALWAKLVVNCAINPLSAITSLPYGKMASQDGVAQLMQDIAIEAVSVARAEGILVSNSVFETIRSIPLTMAGQYSSTAQDLMNGKSTEIDFLTGEVVKRASRHGIDVPINRTLMLLVKSAELSQTANPQQERKR